MAKGSQAWNCYGNLSNLNLLNGYGFCLADNKFDSYKLYLNLTLAKRSFEIKELMDCRGLDKSKILKVCLKPQKFNFELLVYLRFVLRHEFFKVNAKVIKVTELLDLKFDLHCLLFYSNLMLVLFAQSQAKTTLDHDLELLATSSGLTLNQRSALIYRSERKKILKS